MKKVIFFVKKFPILSQTFVIDQVNSLIDNGFDVQIVSFYQEKETVHLASLERNNLLARTHFISPQGAQSVKKPFKLMFIAKFLILSRTYEKKLAPCADLVVHLMKNNKITLAYEIAVTSWKNKSKNFNADSIIAHFGNNGVIANALKNSGILSGHLNTVFHGYEISEYENIELWKNKYVDLAKDSTLLPISNFWKKRLEQWGANSESIRVLRMGVDVDKLLLKYKPVNKPIRIISVARATEKKGLKYAISAMHYLSDDFHLDIIGGGTLQDELVTLSKTIGVDHRITFHGAQSPDYVQKSLEKSDIFLLPSVVDSKGDMEGIPVALMEAMASGLVVVSTYHSGIPELIENGVSGFLVPEHDPEAIAIAINNATNSDALNDVVKEARKKVENEFNSLKLGKELSTLLNKQ